jgi:hypothetical protein
MANNQLMGNQLAVNQGNMAQAAVTQFNDIRSQNRSIEAQNSVHFREMRTHIESNNDRAVNRDAANQAEALSRAQFTESQANRRHDQQLTEMQAVDNRNQLRAVQLQGSIQSFESRTTAI